MEGSKGAGWVGLGVGSWGFSAGGRSLGKKHGSELGLGCYTKGLSPHASSVGLEGWKRGKPRL